MIKTFLPIMPVLASFESLKFVGDAGFVKIGPVVLAKKMLTDDAR